MEEFVDFNDEKIVRKYTNYVLNKINNGLEDLRERDTNFSDELFGREINLLKAIKANFRLYCKDISEEEVKRLSNLIEIYCCLRSLSYHKYCVKNEVNRLNSLVNGD